ncbi:hypothetical protein E3O47_12405 [Cryobacterium sp. TMT2-17-1]|uniref:hypothetical protein n=1 Tax=Cryobacterium sp. TMT2-17-1 TaxID=1259248 RepID=UPI00106BA148|nr:hypothetical protein [Cryobacterium sp. TMT2-17-1]TFC49061.1 hypothetical protein E3O47_12405 [Cryobacterium sp. TMT2-17-1]
MAEAYRMPAQSDRPISLTRDEVERRSKALEDLKDVQRKMNREPDYGRSPQPGQTDKQSWRRLGARCDSSGSDGQNHNERNSHEYCVSNGGAQVGDDFQKAVGVTERLSVFPHGNGEVEYKKEKAEQ